MPLDESARLPPKKVISLGCLHIVVSDNREEDDDVVLPDYEDHEEIRRRVTGPVSITLTDCHRAIEGMVRKTRIVLFEIARKQNFSIWSRDFPQIILQGQYIQFDEGLAEFHKSLDDSLDVWSSIWLDVQEPGDPELDVSLKRLLSAGKDLHSANAKLKHSLLRIETNFGRDVIQPLKTALINRSQPDLSVIVPQAEKWISEIKEAISLRQQEVAEAIAKVKATTTWLEVMDLFMKMKSLIAEAESRGWNRYGDKDFDRLQYHLAFDRADGPTSIMSYLESWLQTAPKRAVSPPKKSNLVEDATDNV